LSEGGISRFAGNVVVLDVANGSKTSLELTSEELVEGNPTGGVNGLFFFDEIEARVSIKISLLDDVLDLDEGVADSEESVQFLKVLHSVIIHTFWAVKILSPSVGEEYHPASEPGVELRIGLGGLAFNVDSDILINKEMEVDDSKIDFLMNTSFVVNIPVFVTLVGDVVIIVGQEVKILGDGVGEHGNIEIVSSLFRKFKSSGSGDFQRRKDQVFKFLVLIKLPSELLNDAITLLVSESEEIFPQDLLLLGFNLSLLNFAIDQFAVNGLTILVHQMVSDFVHKVINVLASEGLSLVLRNACIDVQGLLHFGDMDLVVFGD